MSESPSHIIDILNTRRLTIMVSNTPERGPELHISRDGRNGSVSGYGPMSMPLTRGRSWGVMCLPLPRVRWATGYRLRRIGGRHAYRACQCFYRALGAHSYQSGRVVLGRLPAR